MPGRSGGQHQAPALAMAPGGDFVVVWQDDPDGNGTYQIRARSFRADGSELRAERTVNCDANGQQRAPGAALGDDGLLLVVWEDDMDGNGVYTDPGPGAATQANHRLDRMLNVHAELRLTPPP